MHAVYPIAPRLFESPARRYDNNLKHITQLGVVHILRNQQRGGGFQMLTVDYGGGGGGGVGR